jgi:hypothetical protein
MPLYLGLVQNRFLYLKTAKLVAGYDASKGDSTLTFEIQNKDKVACDYDTATGKIKANDFMMISAGPTLVGYLNEPLIEPFNDVPVTIPSTAVNVNYALSTVANVYDESYRTSEKAVVARDGNDFYFKGITSFDKDVAFKGTLNGDSIYVTVPQYLGLFDGYYMYLSRMDAQESLFGTEYAANDNTETLRFFFDKTTGNITSGDIFGSSTIDGLTDKGIYKPIWRVFNDVLQTIPADAKIDRYILSTSTLDESSKMKSIARIAHKDNTYYFMDINPKDSLAVYVGTRSGNKITCTVPQYVGGPTFNYLNVAYKPFKIKGNSGDSVWTYKLTEDKQLVLNYDEDKDIISSDSLLIFLTIDNQVNKFYYKPVYSKYTPHAATPVDPEPLGWQDFSADFGQYLFNVNIPNEEVNGDFIDPSGMTYSLYFDDSTTPYVFDAARYGADFTADTQNVPYNLYATDFFISGTTRSIYLYDAPTKKIGVSSSYTYNGVKNSSKIVYFELPTEGINNVNTTSVKNEMYYDMTGRRVVNPAHGLFIHKVTYTDGKSRTFKEVIK